MPDEQKPELFQQKALERLRSPEQLDKLFAVTTPAGWVALVALLVLVISGVIWSFFGVMAVKVNGYGVIVDSAGAASIAHTTGGKVTELRVDVGGRVRKGQVIAVLEQSLTEQDIARSKAELNATSSKTEMAVKVAGLNAMNDKLLRDSLVISPYNGIITERKVNHGEIVAASTPLFTIRRDQEQGDMLALVYVPALEGKKVEPGMTVQLSLGTADSGDYGFLIGRVNSVSSYPVSTESINSWIGNKEMSSWIIQKNGGAVMEIRADLIKDPETVSGYLWSSISGAPGTISPGTACTGSIVVKRQAPITKAFQKLNQWLRSD